MFGFYAPLFFLGLSSTEADDPVATVSGGRRSDNSLLLHALREDEEILAVIMAAALRERNFVA